ncbi:MAG: single-stranded DNA-binding protein [Candidatus Gastranaerophilaceae bacterium]|jgi:single-strand DNA-binding protein
MTLCKAVISGKIVRTPEKRFTGNNVAITSFAINIGTGDEENLVRVVATGATAEKAAESLSKDAMVIIEGRLQTNTVKNTKGEDKKIIEILAQNFDIMSSVQGKKASTTTEEELLFDEEETADDLIGEDEIPF